MSFSKMLLICFTVLASVALMCFTALMMTGKANFEVAEQVRQSLFDSPVENGIDTMLAVRHPMAMPDPWGQAEDVVMAYVPPIVLGCDNMECACYAHRSISGRFTTYDPSEGEYVLTLKTNAAGNIVVDGGAFTSANQRQSD